MSLHIIPCTLEEAGAYVDRFHRHNKRPWIARFALACADETGAIHGVSIVGTPDGFNSADGYTAEAKRVCTDGYRNACSILYAASWQAARAMHYKHNLCAHCYEAPIADNGLYCQPCADQIGKEYMDEWSQRVGQTSQP